MSDSAEFLERIRRLYSAVDDVESLPRSWNRDKTIQHISLSHNNLRVHFKGTGKVGKEAAAVRTLAPINAACGIFYFEIKVISKGREGHIGIGLSGPNVSLSKLPGWEKNSYGYHGDDGCAFQSSGTGRQYGPTFSTGDVIGCCWNMFESYVFYTKNGLNLGVAFRDMPSVLFPTVGLQTAGEIVEANFGQHAFAYAIEDYVANCRRRFTARLSFNFSGGVVESAARRAEKEAALRRLVLDYVSAQGYAETATTFARLTNEPLHDSAQSMHDRRRISRLVCCGKVSRAIRLTQRLHPHVFECDPELLFRLRCRQFIEVLDGYDRVDLHTLVAHNTLKNQNQKNGTNGCDSSLKTASAVYVTDFAYVDAEIDENDAETDGRDSLDGNGDVEMCDTEPNLHGCNAALEPRMLSDEELQDLIEFGRLLYSQLLTTYGAILPHSTAASLTPKSSAAVTAVTTVNWWCPGSLQLQHTTPSQASGPPSTDKTAQDSRFERERARLLDAFMRLGCGLRQTSTDSARREREAVAAELNAAILGSRPAISQYRPALETLLGHLRQGVRQMAAAGSVSAGLLELADFVNPNRR